MTLRAATFQDIPRVAIMLHELHAASKYHDRVGISDKAMQDVLMAAVAGQNQHGPQASFFQLSERDGQPIGFMVGTLTRVYHVGDKLVANDLFLYVRPRARASHTFELIDAYVAWAKANRKVCEIALSWNDALPGAERIADVYRRRGFAKNGELFELRTDQGSAE